MCALVEALLVGKLQLQLLVLVTHRFEFICHSVSMLLSKAILVSLLQCVTLTILDSLQQFNLLLQFFVLPLHIYELVFQISNCALDLDQVMNFAVLEHRRVLAI